MINKQNIKYLSVRILFFIPFFRKERIFISYHNKDNLTGPGRFVYNIEKYLKTKRIYLERIFLGRCKKILVISRIPSGFYVFCKKRKIKTFLRVDGFSLPILYDNTSYTYRDYREFTYERIVSNQEIQIGLLKSDFIIYQSEFSKYIADKFLYKRSHNFAIIHNGVDLELFKPNAKKIDHELTLGVLGTLRDIDIISTNLEIYRRLQKSYSNIKLIFMGTVTQEVNLFINNWKNKYLDIGGNIVVTKKLEIDQLPEYLNNIDISLHLTFGDACPNAVLENLACGNPIICPKWGGASELVGDAGVIIDHKPYLYDEVFITKVAEAVEYISSQLDSFSLKARKRAVDNFSLERMGEKYYNVIKDND